MPRKKKEQPVQVEHVDGYEILVGYVKSFLYTEDVEEEMLGHPKVGRCYRIIKAPDGYRLHIGRENNIKGLDGLLLGESLHNSKEHFSFHVEEITAANYLDLGITKDDAKQISEWTSTDNSDLWTKIRAERDGQSAVISSLTDLLKLRDEIAGRPIEIPIEDEASVTFSAQPDELGRVNPGDVKLAKMLSGSLNRICDQDPELFYALLYTIEYIASCYDDKYETKGMPNLSKPFLTQSADLGKGANMYNITKYVQRYSTTGFEKSEQVTDLYKIIHYALFEVQRRRHNTPKTNE